MFGERFHVTNAHLSPVLSRQLVCSALLSQGREICGIIRKDGVVIEYENVAPDPTRDFDMELCIAQREVDEISAVYHSHPSGATWLSTNDINGLNMLRQHGIGWQYLIVTASGVYAVE